jgi:hypothetical protein
MIFEIERRGEAATLPRRSFPVKISGEPAADLREISGVVEVHVSSGRVPARGFGTPLAG